MSDSADELFLSVIDEHRKRPRNRGPLPTANRVARRENPACGDVCVVHIEADASHIRSIRTTGAGCALSQASASLCTVALAGRPFAEALALIARLEDRVCGRDGETPEASPEVFDLGEAAALAAVRAFPARQTCALLAWQAARDALRDQSSPLAFPSTAEHRVP